MDEQSNLKETLDSIDAKIIEFDKAIEDGEKLKRLMKNQDFVDIILDGYIDTEARKLFSILVDPSGASPYSDDKIQLMLAGLSHFKGYIGTAKYDGTIAIDAKRAPGDKFREEIYRKEVTAAAASEEG